MRAGNTNGDFVNMRQLRNITYPHTTKLFMKELNTNAPFVFTRQHETLTWLPTNSLYTCNVCEYEATQKMSLSEHKKAGHERYKYECDLCDYQNVWKQSMIQHKQIKYDTVDK